MLWDYGVVKPDKWAASMESFSQEREMYFPFLDSLGLPRTYENISWRSPLWHAMNAGSWTFKETRATLPNSADADVSTWHQDGGLRNPIPYFGVWSSKSPTQFRLVDDTIVVAPRMHMIVVDNLTVWHRSGRNLKNRHFVRVILPNDWTPQEELKWH